VTQVTGASWTRKHDLPGYVADLANGLLENFTDVPGGLLTPDEGLPVLICKNQDPRLKPFAGATNPFQLHHRSQNAS